MVFSIVVENKIVHTGFGKISRVADHGPDQPMPIWIRRASSSIIALWYFLTKGYPAANVLFNPRLVLFEHGEQSEAPNGQVGVIRPGDC